MTYTSPSTINASQGLSAILNYINYATNQWASNLVLIGIWIIVLMGYYKARDDFAGALAVAGYGTFVVSLFFWIGGFISGAVFGIVIAFAILGTIVLLMDNSNN
jgi:hypothetical protein